jgi:hypothetical protein
MLCTNIAENIPTRRAMLGPGIVIGIAWGTAIFLR